MQMPLLQRLRTRPAPVPAATVLLPGGGIGLDLGAAFARLELRQVLQDAGVRGRV